ERVPHSHSLDGGYGVKSNAKPKLNQQPSRFSISESAKKTGHYPLAEGGSGDRERRALARCSPAGSRLGGAHLR
ncbi:MAG: hypothetical protein WBV28_14610, partial [Terracidiphilus sp.]